MSLFLLKKVCSIPDKIYRYGISETHFYNGGRYDKNRKKIACKSCTYSDSVGTLKAPDILELKNDSITNVKLISNHYVIIDDEYTCYVDDDFVFDVAYHSLNNNGKLSGEFKFCKIGSDLKLLRVDGPVYNQVLDSSARRTAPKLKKKDFEVGGVYATLSGSRSIFLGKIDTYKYFGFTNDTDKLYSKDPIKNNLLFYDLHTWRSFDNFDISTITEPNALSLKKSTSFIEKVGTVDVSTGGIDILKKNLIQALKKSIVSYSQNNSYQRTNWFHYLVRRYAPFINMVESGQKIAAPLDMQKYLTYV